MSDPQDPHKVTGSSDELQAIIHKQAAALSEQKDRTTRILRTIPLGLLVFNPQQRIQMSNQLAIKLLGYESGRDLKGQSLTVVFPEVDRIILSAEPLRTIARRKNEETFPVEIYLNEWEEGLIFAHILDITERHRLERLRQDFLAMVSHDLRSPLTAVRFFLQMISQGTYGEMSPTFQKATTRAESSVDLMVSLVNDLLDTEQIQSGDLKLEIRATSTGTIVDRAIAACQGSAKTAEVELETDVTNDGLDADEERLVRVIVNLVGNAIKFSPPGSKITVHAGIEGTGFLFRVQDRGPGIPEHLQKVIFERYRQLDQPSETKSRGVGLGLSICKALVEKHKGKIWVESKPGEGSTFCFSIPMIDSA